MGDKPALKPYPFALDQYDRVIIGTPVWASTFTPPIRSFVDATPNLADKTVGVFTCFSGGGADKAISKLKAYLGIESLAAELILTDPKDRPKAENDEKIVAFCAALA